MNTKTKTFVITALYVAIFVILGKIATINFGTFKLTLKNLPIFVGAITMGSIPGAIIGFTGELILQLTGEYGFTATTLFWVMPQTLLGAVCGVIFENNKVKITNGIKFYVCIITLQLFITILNTIVWCIDSLIFGYFNYVTLFGSLTVRFMNSLLVGVVFCILIPLIIKITKKIH